MLFDLRGKRKRAVQAVYLSLAILMGGGLVLFGIGGNVSGGLFDAFSGRGGSGSSGFGDQIERAQKRLETSPKDREALLTLTRLRFQAANSGGNADPNTGRYSAEGRKELERAASAWERYLKTDPPRPSPGAALVVVRAYEALGDYESAAKTQRIVARSRPSRGALVQLATFLYYAGKVKEGDRMKERALAKAAAGDRTRLRRQLLLARYGQQALDFYLDGKVKQGDMAGRLAVAQVPKDQRASLRRRVRELKQQAASFRKQQAAQRQPSGAPGGGQPPPDSPFAFPPGGGLTP